MSNVNPTPTQAPAATKRLTRSRSDLDGLSRKATSP